jgi:hypothetical protein
MVAELARFQRVRGKDCHDAWRGFFNNWGEACRELPVAFQRAVIHDDFRRGMLLGFRVGREKLYAENGKARAYSHKGHVEQSAFH